MNQTFGEFDELLLFLVNFTFIAIKSTNNRFKYSIESTVEQNNNYLKTCLLSRHSIHSQHILNNKRHTFASIRVNEWSKSYLKRKK